MASRNPCHLEQPARLELFIGVIMSVLAGLIFTVIYLSLSVSGSALKMTTPLVSPSSTSPVFFECRDNTIFKPDIDELQDRTRAAFKQCVGSNRSRLDECEKVLARMPQKNAYYSTKPVILNCPGETKRSLGMTLVEVPGSKGENSMDLQDPGSNFQHELARLDPARHHLIFIVRNDSFAVFHSARRVARKMGFRSGWEPFDRKTELGLGCPGNSSGFRALPQ